MRPSSRSPVNKRKSGRSFEKTASRTKSVNYKGASMRGGWRF